MDRHRPSSLYKLTLIETVVNAWNVVDFNTIDSQEYVEKDYKLQENTAKIIEKIALLPLPKTVQKDLNTLVRPIGLRILGWVDYHECFFNKTGHTATDFVSRLTWTQRGTVEQTVTVKELIRSENLQLIDRFQLACIYCLEGHIRTLWQQFGDSEILNFIYKWEKMPILVKFWYHRLTGDVAHLPQLDDREHLWRKHRLHPDRYGFVLALETKNETAVRWLWKNIESGLSREQRKHFLVSGIVFLCKQRPILTHTSPLNFPNEHCAQILLFLLAQMSAEQIRHLGKQLSAKGGSAELLKYLLDWPYQRCLAKLARLLGDSLSVEDYVKVLLKIVDKIENVLETDYDYGKLFANFWEQNGSLNGQLEHTHIAELLVRLLNIGHISNRDAGNIKAVISDVGMTEKQKLMQDVINLQKVCFALVKRGLWSLYEMLLRSCAGAENDLNEWKSKVFALVGQNICKDLIVRDKNWNLVQQFAKISNLSKEMIALLMQDLESHEANYMEKKMISKSRKRNAVTNYRVLAKKQSR